MAMTALRSKDADQQGWQASERWTAPHRARWMEPHIGRHHGDAPDLA
jgi:hypothetical protein